MWQSNETHPPCTKHTAPETNHIKSPSGKCVCTHKAQGRRRIALAATCRHGALLKKPSARIRASQIILLMKYSKNKQHDLSNAQAAASSAWEKHIENDSEIADVYKTLTRKIRHFFRAANSPVSHVYTLFNAVKYCRAMIGHILAATSVTECRREPCETLYFTPLQHFVLGDDRALDDTHDIYYWFFPHKHHQSIKIFSMANEGNQCSMSILSFFPLAFLLTEKGKGIYPTGAIKLELSDNSLFVELSALNIDFSTFPAVELRGNQMVALVDSISIVSYPIT